MSSESKMFVLDLYKRQKAKYFSNDEKDKDRLIVYEDLWETVDEKLQVLQSDLNTKIFEDLLRFVENAYADFVPGQGWLPGKPALTEIPTAALITGVNMPDHGVMFSNLSALLEESVTPHVALLRSKDCPNVKNIMTKTVAQFMENADLVGDDDDEEEGGIINVNRISSTMSNLASWYQAVSKRPPKSPRKKQKIDDSFSIPKTSPLVIILEDLESFPAHVLQDFITICSGHLSDIPIVLVFGIATAVTAVHQLLPHQVSCLLSMEKFQAPPSSHYLTSVIQKVLLTPSIPFKLGPKVFNMLLDLFLYHDFSVLNFIRGLKFSMMEHFLNSQTSILCQSSEEAVRFLRFMKHAEVEKIRHLPSFRRYVEKSDPQKQIDLLTDDRLTKKATMELLAEIEEYHEHFYPVMQCLHCMTKNLPGYPLGKQLRELYSICLTSNVSESPDYQHTMALLKSLSRDELVQMLQQCKGHLSGDEGQQFPEAMQALHTQIQTYLEKLENIEELSKIHPDEDDGEEETEELLPKKMNMYALRQKLEEMGKRKKKLTVYEVLRNEVIDCLDEVFQKYLTSPMTLPLHEIFYFNNVAGVKNNMIGMPRAVIQNALSTPHQYIQAAGCETDGGAIPPTLLDLCIVYKLHLECGRLINLYDWLQAFITIVQVDEDDDGEQKKPEKLLQARFIRAVSELQFLGFIKPTKRKTDHVARLTWGGC